MTTDVAVIGAGPAGTTAAKLLASWGYSVLVLDRPSRAQHSLAESLPPSTRRLLSFLGLLDAVDAAHFHPNHGNVARWAGERRVTQTDAPGFHVSRAAFDRVLRDSAAAAGARIVNATVHRVDRGDGTRLDYTTGEGRAEMAVARFVLDCSGRAGVIARRGLRRTDSRYRTLALAARWESPDWPAAERAHTIVESCADAWAWSVPLSDTRRQFTVMIDPLDHHRGGAVREPPLPRSVSNSYAQGLAKTKELSVWLANARQTCEPWACDASLYDCSRAAEEGVLLVGDAASFIEPLSSAGVKKALTSAWRAAVVANTCLSKPQMAAAAADFYEQREREIYADCLRRSTAFFSEACVYYNDSFWSARASSGPGAGAQDAAAKDAATPRDAQMRDAFDRLRREGLVRLRPAESLQFAPTAEIEGREVVMREAVVLPGTDRPLRFAAGVNLPALVRLAPRCDEIAALIASYHSEVGPAPVEGLLTGLSLLVAHRALINEGSPV